MNKGEIAATVILIVSLLYGVTGSIGYLMFDGWKGTLTMWIMMTLLIASFILTIVICTYLGLTPSFKK